MAKRDKKEKTRIHRVIFLIVIISLASYGVGYAMGYEAALRWSVKLATHFVEIDIDKEELVFAIQQYKDRINACYPDINNASIRNDERS